MRKVVVCSLALLAFTSWILGATRPPLLLNYQGALRNGSEVPENGDRDMIFHFWDANEVAIGNEIMRDKHTVADGTPVTVTDGLFNVQLGVGGGGLVQEVIAGYDSLEKMFRDYETVYLEVEARVGPAGGIGAFETLAPRIRVVSAAYALNADHLDGKTATDFIDNSINGQIKSGQLTLSGGVLGLGASTLSDAQVATLTGGVASVADALHTHNLVANAANASNANTLDALDSTAFLRSNANTSFSQAGTTLTCTAGTTMNVAGTFQLAGVSVASTAAELNKLGGTGPTVTALNLNALTNGGNANTLHTHTNTNAATLDGLDSTDFVRKIGDTMTGALTMNTGAQPNAVFNEQEIRVDDAAADTLFTIRNSDPVRRLTLQLDGDLRVGVFTAVGDTDSIFFDDGVQESLAWDDPEARFELTDGLAVQGQLMVGGPFLADIPVVGYNRFASGAGAPTSGDITLVNDVWIQGDLEVNESLYVPQIESNSHLRFMIDKDASAADGADVEFAQWYHNGVFGAANDLMRLDEDGDLHVAAGGVFTADLDLAETYLKGEPVEPGDLVRVDPERQNAVRLTSHEGDSTVLGVVSTKPGFVLGGTPFSAEQLRKVWGEDVRTRYEGEAYRLESEYLALAPELRGGMKTLAQSGLSSPTAENASPLLKDRTPEESAARQRSRQEGEWIEGQLEMGSIELFFKQNFVPVALAGRAPVKVDTRFGHVRIGDLLAPSPIPGVAMKATKAGPVIGTALEDFSGGRGKVMAFIHRGSFTPADDGHIAREIESRMPDEKTGTQTMEGNLQIVLDKGADDRSRFSVFRDGAGHLSTEVFRVDEEGNVYARGSFRPASLDLAEYHPVSEPVEVGDVLVADVTRAGTLRKGNIASDPAVVGIVSGAPGILLGSGIAHIASVDPDLAARLDEARSHGDRNEEARLWSELEGKFTLTHAAVALSGTVPCKVDASYGAIHIGDLLAASPTPGHAMRTPDGAAGTILGKALESWDSGKGVIKVLVMLR